MKRNKLTHKQRRCALVLIVTIGMLMMGASGCDDDENTIPDTGVDNADELIENVADGAENVDDTLDTLWCLGSVNDWEIRCGGDGVKPTD